MKFKIQFINHACFQIIRERQSILVDPWFFGKVFNNSWELLKETDINQLDLSNLTHIFISHEHPDHLHWPTLKKIKEKCSQDINVFMVKRGNGNIKEALEKMGFMYREFEPYQFYRTNKYDFSFCFIKKDHDCAILFDIEDKIIFNKNDCEFRPDQMHLVKEDILRGRNIDFLFNQFSLAGYYGNPDDTESLQKAKERHIKDLVDTHNVFMPQTTVPFASFIRFCRKENKHLNDYIVHLDELLQKHSNLNLTVPFYLEYVQDSCSRENSIKNSQKWKNIFNDNFECEEVPVIAEQEMKKIFKNFCIDFNLSKQSNYFPIPTNDFVLNVTDLDKSVSFNFCNATIDFKPLSKNSIADVVSYDLAMLFKNPWGADTMNITACFTVRDAPAWRKLIIFKDICYAR